MAYKTKAQIRNAILRDEQISLESATTVGGRVLFVIDRRPEPVNYMVNAREFATIPEQEIDTLDELVDYIWQNRKRVIA
jgi:hypothetical protein